MVRLAQAIGAAYYIGEGSNYWPNVHVEDLASAFVLALERAPAGTVVNVAASSDLTRKQAAVAISQAAGTQGRTVSWTLEQALKQFGPRARFGLLDQQVSAEKARRLLGWQVERPSLLDELASGSYTPIGTGPGWHASRDDNKRLVVLTALNLLRLHLEGVKASVGMKYL